MAQVAQLTVRISGQIADLQKSFQQANQQTQQFQRRFEQMADRVERNSTKVNTAMIAIGSAIGNFASQTAFSLISKLTDSIGDFIQTGLQLTAVEQSFNRLASSMNQNAAAMLAGMNAATKGLVSDFDLMLAANKAMLLGLPVTSESMQDLAKTAVVLGRAMGLNATQALNDLITALGRSSPLILDNLGLTVKVGEANERYAQSLGKTVDQLTEAEKKTAFYTAAMEAARQKTAEIGEQSVTLGDKLTAAWTSAGNAVSRFVGFINRGGVPLPAQKPTLDLSGTRGSGLGRAITLPGDTQPDPKAAEEAKKQAEAFSKSVQNLTDRLKGNLSQMKLWEVALGRIGDVSKLTRSAQDEVNRSLYQLIQAAEAAGVAVPTSIRKAFDATVDWTRINQEVDESLKRVESRINSGRWEMNQRSFLSKPTILDVNEALRTTEQLTDQIFSSARAEIYGRNTAAIADQTKAIGTRTKEWGKELDNVSRALAQLATVSGDSFGGILQGISSIVSAVSAMQSSFKAISAGGILNIFSGGLGLVSGALSIGQTLGKLFDRNKGRDMVEAFAETFGGFDQLHKKLQTLGDEGERLWVRLTQGVGRNNTEQATAAIEAINQAFGDQANKANLLTQAMQEYGFSWEDLGEKLRAQKLGEIFADLQAKTDVLKDAGIDYTEILKRQSGQYSELVQAAIRSGTEIPASMQKTITDLHQMGLLVDANGNALEDLGQIKWAQTLTQNFDRLIDRFDRFLGAIGESDAALDHMARPRNIEFRIDTTQGPGFVGPPEGGRSQTVNVILEGRTIARTVVENMPDELDVYGVS